jgi:hypothetical protein
MNLTKKQLLFSEHMAEGNDKIASALYAGYPPRSAQVIACQNLRKDYIVAKIAELRLKAHKEATQDNRAITKESLSDFCMADYLAVEPKDANRVRFLELTAKLNKLIGVEADTRPNQTLNINLLPGQDRDTLLANVRCLLSHQDSQP